MSTEIKPAGSGRSDKADKADRADKQARLELARKRFKLCVDAESTLRQRMLEDQRFAAGEHWPQAVKNAREGEGRPCLTIDRLTPQLKQVANQQRAMRPSVQINAVDSGADPETAEVLQGLIRHIENQSDADDAYDQAGLHQLEIGRGWIRIVTKPCEDGSGNQDIRIERVRNPFKVWIDPTVERRDYADAKYAFEAFDFLSEELSARWPKASHTLVSEFMSGLGDDAPNWIDGERIRVVKAWRVDTVKEVQNGRTIERRKVSCDFMSGLEILESYEWAGKFIPLIPVLGDEREIEGELDLRGMVRGAKDPQRMFNYWKSATTEAMALAPKAPFIVAEGQVEPYKHLWKTANSKNHAYLPYRPTTLAGQPVPAPQRQFGEPPIQAMMMNQQAAEADLRAATGFFDVGEKEAREQSGRAILARQQMGQHGNADYLDGLARAIRFAGRQLIDLAPKIYDVPRVVRIIGGDNQPKNVMVHGGQAPAADPLTGAPALPPGVEQIYDLSVGTYDVSVSVGPSLPSKRAEFVQQMGEFLKGQPGMLQMVGDLLFEEMDIPNAKRIAERFRKMLPPALQEGQGGPDPAQMAGQLQQATQAAQAMQQKIQELEAIVNGKQIEAQSKEKIAVLEIQHKERLAELEAQLAQFKAITAAGMQQQKLEHDAAKTAASFAHDGTVAAIEHQHEREMSARAHVQAQETRALEAEHGDKAA